MYKLVTHQIWKDRVCLYEFLGVPVSESLEQERSHTGSRTPGNGVTEYKPLQAVAVVSLPVKDVKDLLIQTLSLTETKIQYLRGSLSALGIHVIISPVAIYFSVVIR